MNDVLTVLVISFVLVIAVLIGDARERNARFDEIEQEIKQVRKKDALRDTWMRAHRGELMQRIENRGILSCQ